LRDYLRVTTLGPPPSGVTLHECLKAAAATSGRIVVAEDHHPEDGLGSAVTECLLESGRTSLHIAHLAVRGMPGSGTGRELMAWAGIDADHIAAAARGLVGA
jgi:transketolase